MRRDLTDELAGMGGAEEYREEVRTVSRRSRFEPGLSCTKQDVMYIFLKPDSCIFVWNFSLPFVHFEPNLT